jgi:hypothetical protein
VARAFSVAPGRDVRVEQIPRHSLEESFRSLGLSEAAAYAYGRMTKATIDGAEAPSSFDRGESGLEEHIARLVGQAMEAAVGRRRV